VGGAPPPAGGPPPGRNPRPPTSPPPHQTPERSGWPSAIFGAGPGFFSAALGAALLCAAAVSSAPATSHATAVAAAAAETVFIVARVIVELPPLLQASAWLRFALLLWAEQAVRRAVRSLELLQHAHVLRVVASME